MNSATQNRRAGVGGTAPEAGTGDATNGRRRLVDALVLLAVVLVAHGGSLGDGLFFDDYWHRVTLREYGWSFHDLVESATFDLPGPLVHLWWQETPLQWRYARPVAMLVMKVEYLVSGGNPVGVHAFALLWHFLATLLVYRLAMWALQSRGWALFAAAVFAAHPQAVFGVSWTAARNALFGGLLMIAAAYAYVRASAPGTSGSDGRLRRWPFCVAVVLWLGSLFSRETAIVLPGLLVVLDLATGGLRRVAQRIPAYVLLAVVGGLYLYWRLAVFPTSSPPDIYFTAPAGPGYAIWAASKLLHMLFALFFQTPMFLGLATYSGVGPQQMIEHVVIGVLLAAVLAWYLWASRGLATRWLWPVWAVLAFVPVIPVFVMPHFAYVPAVGMGMMVAIMLRGLRGRWRQVAIGAMCVYLAYCTGLYRFLFRGIVRAEQVVYADIRSQADPPAGADLVFINLPVAAIYGTVAMRESWQEEDLDGHVLTFAPHPLVMADESTVEAVDAYTLEVRSPSPGYFSGMGGAMMIDGMRGGEPLEAGLVVAGPLFDTTVLEANAEGVQALRFRFHRPLAREDLLVFVSTPERPAQRLRFGMAPEAPDPRHAVLFEAARADDPAVAEPARARLTALARPIAQQLADPIRARLAEVSARSAPRGEVASEADVADGRMGRERASIDALEVWWSARHVSDLLEERGSRSAAFRAKLVERERFFAILRFYQALLRSDLLLTGGDVPAPNGD